MIDGKWPAKGFPFRRDGGPIGYLSWEDWPWAEVQDAAYMCAAIQGEFRLWTRGVEVPEVTEPPTDPRPAIEGQFCVGNTIHAVCSNNAGPWKGAQPTWGVVLAARENPLNGTEFSAANYFPDPVWQGLKYGGVHFEHSHGDLVIAGSSEGHTHETLSCVHKLGPNSSDVRFLGHHGEYIASGTGFDVAGKRHDFIGCIVQSQAAGQPPTLTTRVRTGSKNHFFLGGSFAKVHIEPESVGNFVFTRVNTVGGCEGLLDEGKLTQVWSIDTDRAVIIKKSLNFKAHRNGAAQTGLVTAPSWNKLLTPTEKYDHGGSFDAANSQAKLPLTGIGYDRGVLYLNGVMAFTRVLIRININGAAGEITSDFADASNCAVVRWDYDYEAVIGNATVEIEFQAIEASPGSLSVHGSPNLTYRFGGISS